MLLELRGAGFSDSPFTSSLRLIRAIRTHSLPTKLHSYLPFISLLFDQLIPQELLTLINI